LKHLRGKWTRHPIKDGSGGELLLYYATAAGQGYFIAVSAGMVRSGCYKNGDVIEQAVFEVDWQKQYPNPQEAIKAVLEIAMR